MPVTLGDLIRELEALRIGPDEVLIVRVPRQGYTEDGEDIDSTLLDELLRAFDDVGLTGRALLVMGLDDAEFSVVKR